MDSPEQDNAVLRRDALGRRWTPAETRDSILDEFERSGLKGAQFARLAGVNYGTFATWVQKRRHARGQYPGGAPAGWVGRRPLQLVEAVVATASAKEESSVLKVLLPGGASVGIADVGQARLAAQLLKALEVSC